MVNLRWVWWESVNSLSDFTQTKRKIHHNPSTKIYQENFMEVQHVISRDHEKSYAHI